MKFQELFLLAMKREIPELLTCDGPSYDCGASGKFSVPGAIALGLPDWELPANPIPAESESVGTIHAYHFLEHLKNEDAILFLREVERILKIGGIFNFCVPQFNTIGHAYDITHKSIWCEETFTNLFKNKYYIPSGEWKLRQHFAILIGLVSRNLVVIGQLEKI